MKSLEFLSQLPPVIRDNFNRDCSVLRTRTCVDLLTREKVDCFVCHSAVTRSTFNVNQKDHAESFALLEFVVGCQALVNLAVESLQAGQTVAAVWRRVLTEKHSRIHGLSIHGGDVVRHAAVPIVAHIPQGAAVLHLGGHTWLDLDSKLERLA